MFRRILNAIELVGWMQRMPADQKSAGAASRNRTLPGKPRIRARRAGLI